MIGTICVIQCKTYSHDKSNSNLMTIIVQSFLAAVSGLLDGEGLGVEKCSLGSKGVNEKQKFRETKV
jgi:hypothetical protein